ncbi:MAG: hypothetical protein U1D55_14545 [Phycisphaerae bacterium]
MKRFFSFLLFWFMFLGGGAILAAALLLPAWLDYEAARARHRQALERETEHELRQTILSNQIEHLRSDPAYVDRLARRELGIDAGQVQTIVLLPPASDEIVPEESPAESALSVDDDEISVTVRVALQRYPALGLLLNTQLRPLLIGLAAGLVLTALVLLNRQRPRNAPIEQVA